VAALVRSSPLRELRHLVYACADGAMREEIARAGAEVRVIPKPFPKLDPLWVLRLARAMRRDAIDLVHTHLFGDSLHGRLAASAAGGLPVVMTVHIGREGLSLPQRFGYRWLIPRCARVVACSASVRASLIEGGVAEPEQVGTIPNGIDLACASPVEGVALRQDLGITPAQIVYLGAGRLSAQKGFEFLITAFARLVRATGSASPPRLLLAGEGEALGALTRQAFEEGVAEHVHFLGFRTDLPRLLAAADVVAFPSLYEGLPLGVLEAMAAERCIVATRIPGHLEALDDAREALLVPPRDASRLAEALARVGGDPELRGRLGAAAQRRQRRDFSADRMATAYRSLYCDVLGDAGFELAAARGSRAAR
jgi:glycosyltransferase involved in cell wall biosynthesis